MSNYPHIMGASGKLGSRPLLSIKGAPELDGEKRDFFNKANEVVKDSFSMIQLLNTVTSHVKAVVTQMQDKAKGII